MEDAVGLIRSLAKMKNYLITIIAFAAGILLGMAVRPLSVRAQATAIGTVYVDEVGGRNTSGTAIKGSQIVGYSCAEDGNGAIHCYVASVNRR
jgi:hypothetical protein